MKKGEHLVSVTWANWLNILPDLREKKVLIIGVEPWANTESISNSGAALLCCIGDSCDQFDDDVNKYYPTLEDCVEAKFDIVIVGDLISFALQNSYQFSYAIPKIVNLVTDDGALLLCCSSGWKNAAYRRIISRIMSKQSIGTAKYYFCDPSLIKPYQIIPVTDDSSWLIENYPNVQERPYRKLNVLKRWVRTTIFKVLGILNPLRGLAMVIDNSKSIQDSDLNSARAIENSEKFPDSNSSSLKVCITADYMMKHYLFEYSRKDRSLLQVEKIAYQDSGSSNPLEFEHKNMTLMNDLIGDLKKNKIAISQPIEFSTLTPCKSTLTMTAVQGQSLLYMVEKNIYLENYDDVFNLLSKATDIQICFQKLSEKIIPLRLDTLPSDYGVNYMELEMEVPAKETKCIQHGDYAANNIIVDSAVSSWGIIDWESLREGFPPLLDIFSLHTSVHFTNGEKCDDIYDEYYRAFITTFFSTNWFSKCLLNNLYKYCHSFNIQQTDIYAYFLRYLIIHCNKYRIVNIRQKSALASGHKQLYERVLNFAICNESRFITNQDFRPKQG